MKRAKIEITTEADGERSVFSAVGTAEEREGGLLLRFRDEADETEFFIGEIAIMERKGACGLKLVFERGKETEAKMTVGENEGQFDLFTKEYHHKTDADQAMVYVKYILKFSGGNRNMKVKLKAKFTADAV